MKPTGLILVWGPWGRSPPSSPDSGLHVVLLYVSAGLGLFPSLSSVHPSSHLTISITCTCFLALDFLPKPMALRPYHPSESSYLDGRTQLTGPILWLLSLSADRHMQMLTHGYDVSVGPDDRAGQQESIRGCRNAREPWSTCLAMPPTQCGEKVQLLSFSFSRI